MKNTKKFVSIVALVAMCCLLTAVVDGVIQPDYEEKAFVKIILFLALPFIYASRYKELDIKSLFKANKKGIKLAFVLCIPVFVLIIGAYFALKDIFDFSAITKSLTENIGVNRNNFIFVALYISFINSLLEEFFFRGFAFLTLKKVSSSKFAYIFSAGVFAIYHIAIMRGWFSLPLFAITIAGLFVGGLVLNYLNDKSNNIYTSWLVHMFANFGINTVGLILFGII